MSIKQKNKCLSGAALLASLFCTTNSALAATYTWTGSTDGDFGNAQNWDLLAVPNFTDNAIFPAAGSNKAITISASQFVGSLVFNDPGYSITVGPAGLLQVQSGGIGGTNSATLTNNFSIIFKGTAGSSTILNNAGLTFINSSTAGNASITSTPGSIINFSDTSNAGNATIAVNAANLLFTLSGTAPNATVTSTGASNITLANNNASIGSLSGSGVVTLGSNTITLGGLNQNDAISGGFNGTGGVTKIGSGHLTLSGPVTYSGTTSVLGGLMTMPNLNNAAIINAGSTLFVTNANTPSLTLGVNGPAIGTLNASGTATLTSTNLQVNFAPASYSAATVYTLVQGGTIVGPFASVVSTPAMLIPNLTYNANSVTMQIQGLEISDALSSGLSYNQQEVVEELNEIFTSSSITPEWQSLQDIFSVLSQSELAAAVDMISPDELNGTKTTVLNQTINQITDIASNRARAFMHFINKRYKKPPQHTRTSKTFAQSPIATLARGDKANFMDGILSNPESHFEDLKRLSADNHMVLSEGRGGLWVQPFGNVSRLDGSANRVGYHAKTGGITIGADKLVDHNTLAGVSMGYGHSQLKFAGGIGRSNVNTIFMSLYGSMVKKAFHMDAALTGGINRFEEARNIKFSTVTANTSNRHRGYSLSPHIGAGYDFTINETLVEPFVSFDYNYNREKGYTESGGGALNLAVRSKDTAQIQSEIGVRASKTIKSDGRYIIPEISLSYINTAPTKKEKLVAAFAGEPGTFINVGPNAHRNYASLGGKADIINNNSGDILSFSYTAKLSNKFSSHQASVSYGIPL